MADYEPLAPTQGNLIGICPACGCLIYRRVNAARLDQVRGCLEVRAKEALKHLGERTDLSVNSAFRAGGEQ
jgi:hypothetical protein